MSYRDDLRRWRSAVQAAKAAGMPPPARPDPPRRTARRRAQARDPETVAQGLFGKLLTGGGTPGQGIVPYSFIPKQARDQIPMRAPPVGWDPRQLDPDELQLLERLVQAGMPEQTAISPQERARIERMSIQQQAQEARMR